MPETGIEYTLLRAVRFAADRHRNQRRKDQDASPYINHPIAVAETLSRHGVTDPVALQAAILHDTIEDTETTPGELEESFGVAVRDAVMEVTDDNSLEKEERKLLQIDKAPTLSTAAKRVKLGFHVLSGWADPADDEQIMKWTDEFHDAMAPHATPGVYVNLLSENESDRIPEAYGDNHERLAAIMGKWDPDNFFRHNQNIEPAG